MNTDQARSAGPWDDAVHRATAATAAQRPGDMDENCWDDVAIRDIIAMVLYGLHLRDRQPVGDVDWSSVLWQLRDDERVSTLVRAVLPAAGHDLGQQGASGDLVVERWRWLTRTWDPNAHNRPPAPWHSPPGHGPGGGTAALSERRWGGMSRGIASGLPDPALEICTNWAASVVQATIAAEHFEYSTFERVCVTAGPLQGHRGYVRELGWVFDDAAQTVHGPAGYVVDLDDTEGMERIDADQLISCSDQRWPRRPEGTLKDRPAPGLHDPAPPWPTCAEDLAQLLERASNPEAVPAELQRTIASAKHHHHLQMDRQASPEPRRFSWQVVMHWYQLTEHYSDEQRADVWEVEVKRHLHDPEPVCYLTLSEAEVPEIIARHTGVPQ